MLWFKNCVKHNINNMKLKLILSLSWLLFAAYMLPAQVPEGLPEAYDNQTWSAAEEKVRLLKENFDVVLDPVEQIAIRPSDYDVQAGNWANQWFGTSAYYQAIKSAAQRPVFWFIHDTAGDSNHPDLQAVLDKSRCQTFTGETVKLDEHGHGTHVLGCIAALKGNIEYGVARMLVEAGKARAALHKCLNKSGAGNYPWITASLLSGIEKGKVLQQQGWFVIHNLSLGGSSPDAALSAAIQKARDAGQLVIIAAGNNGQEKISHPGADKNANAIGALADANGNRASYSNYGPELYAAAPGSNIISTHLGNAYAQMSGTSMATPILAGIAGIHASMNPQATANQIERSIAANSYNLGTPGWDKFFGYGSPLLSGIISKSPLEFDNTKLKNGEDPRKPGYTDPDPDPDPPVDSTLRENREVRFVLPAMRTIWKTSSGTAFRDLEIFLTVVFNTRLQDDAAFDYALTKTKTFFTNRGLVLLDHHGFVDATFYSRHFFEMILKREGWDVKVETITGVDGGVRTTTLQRASMQKTGTKIKLWFQTIKPYTFTYKGLESHHLGAILGHEKQKEWFLVTDDMEGLIGVCVPEGFATGSALNYLLPGAMETITAGEQKMDWLIQKSPNTTITTAIPDDWLIVREGRAITTVKVP